MRRADVTKDRVRAVAVTGQYASTVPVDANGRADRSLSDVAGHPRARVLATGHRRTDRGLQPAKDPALRAKVRRRHPHRPAPTRSARCSISLNREPEIVAATRWYDGAGRLPHDAFHRCRVGDPRVATGELADRQSRPHPLRVRRTAPAASSASTGDYLPPLQPFGSVVGTVTRDVAEDLGLSRTRS